MLKERIIDYVKKEAYRPLSAEDLAEALAVRGEELPLFWQELKELEADAALIKTRHDKYGAPERMNLVVGILSVTSKGFGFVVPETRATSEDTDLFIPAAFLGGAMNNDRVVARIGKLGGMGKTREGEIIRIVKRANKRIVGTFENSRSFGFVVPDDTRLNQDIFIAKDDTAGARTGAKVVVEITSWPERRRSAEGRIIEVLGMAGEVGVDILSVIKKYDLPMEFSPATQKAALQIPEQISPSEIEGRCDRREWTIVTIDGDDAKDLDDGVYVEQIDERHFLLGVYIADVSYYVKEDTPLDAEAQERGTSVYLVDRVLPMLPQRLSNGICSLNAGEDRLAMSVEMKIDLDGRICDYDIFPCVIHVYRRLTYNIVSKILVEHDKLLTEDNRDIQSMLEDMKKLSLILRRKRERRGAIDFDIPEIKVRLDQDGKPVRLVKRVRNLAESIIEEFMLAANETVAEHMSKLKLPFMYRIHENPDVAKLERLGGLLATFNLSLPYNAAQDKIPPAALRDTLSQVRGRPEERIVSTVMLRSMKQARYAAENIGHYGLAARYYAHFTSPIRRYPDLLVHRLLRDTFKTGTMAAKRKAQWERRLPELAEHTSIRERVAADAERETNDLKKVEYMVQFIGEEFDGIISNVTSFGLFVELDNGIEGLVRVSGMENDYYKYVEEEYALVGERTNSIYRLGDAVTVIVLNANVESRSIDFVLKDNGTFIMPLLQRHKFVEPEPKDGGVKSSTGVKKDKKVKKGRRPPAGQAEEAPKKRRRRSRSAKKSDGSAAKRR